MSQAGPKNGKRYPPYNPVEFARLSAKFIADAKAGKFDNDVDDTDDLPDLAPAPVNGEETVACSSRSASTECRPDGAV